MVYEREESVDHNYVVFDDREERLAGAGVVYREAQGIVCRLYNMLALIMVE